MIIARFFRKCIYSALAGLALILPIAALHTPANAQTTLIDNMFKPMQAIVDMVDMRRLSIAGQADLLDRNVDSIIAFVRNDVVLDIYEGSLRGARGALLSRSGNPLDQALLLEALLKAAGFDTRLRKIGLSTAERDNLLYAYANAGHANLRYLVSSREVADRLGLAPADMDGIRNKQEKARAEILSSARRWEQVLAPMTDNLLEERVSWDAFARWFYLVEYRRDDGAWQGANPVAGFEPASSGALARFDGDQIPAALQHRFSLRLLLRMRDSGGAISETPLAGFSAPTAKLYMTAVSVSIAPDNNRIFETPALLERGLEGSNMVMTLSAGDAASKVIRYFNMSGEVSETQFPAAQGAAKSNSNALAGLGGALGGIFGNAPAPAETSARLVDIVMEYGYETPQGSSRVIRRSLAQLHGVERLERAVFWKADISVESGPIPRQPVAISRLKAMLAFKPLILALAKPSASPLATGKNSASLERINKALASSISTAAVNFSLNAQEAARKKWQHLYQPAPTIVAVEGILSVENGEVRGRSLLDLVAINTVAMKCDANGCVTPSPRSRYEAGILWTAAERDFMADLSDPARLLSRKERRAAVANAGGLLEEETAPGGKLELRRIGLETELATAFGSSDPAIRTAMQRDVQAGYRLVVTGAGDAAPANWWRFDPASGGMIGTGRAGRGGSATQSAILNANVILFIKSQAAVASMLGCMYGLAAIQTSKKFGPAYFAGKTVFCIAAGTLGIAGVAGQLGAGWGAVGIGAGVSSLGADVYELSQGDRVSATDGAALSADAASLLSGL